MNARDENLPGQWIGRRSAVEFPPRSPELTPLDFYLWGTLNDVVYRKKTGYIGGISGRNCNGSDTRGHFGQRC